MTSVFENWGLKCPKCGRNDQLHITAETVVRLLPDGTKELFDGYEWTKASPCCCDLCGFAGLVESFDAEVQP